MANTTNFSVEKPQPGGYRNSWGGTLNVGLDKIDELLHLALPLGTIQMYPKSTAPTATTNGGTWLLCDGSTKVRTDYPELHTLITNTFGAYPSASTFVLPDFRARIPVGYNTTSGLSGRGTKAIAASGGDETHTLLDAEIPKHTHPITDTGHVHATTEVNHVHTGTTADANTDITIADHHHGFDIHATWQSGNYGVAFTNGGSPSATQTDATSLSITDNGHGHSFTTAGAKTDLTIDNNNTGITVNDQGTGDTAHNNMQPYIVVNYIILAKHPTF